MHKVSDKPLTDPKEDKFGHAKFAEQFANAITKVDSSECLVYALCGPWGSGKTSCLNFIQGYLKEDDRIKVLHFSPWWYSGKHDLLTQFFKEFGTLIGQNKGNHELLKNLIDYAVIISEFPEPTGTAKFLGSILKATSNKLKKRDINELRKKLKDKLTNSKDKYLVIIDDIDRLSGEEIADIFKIVKAIADFPNVIYLMVYDKKVVKESLKVVQPGIEGEQYLEKIVQIYFDIPAIDKLKLQSLFVTQMEQILESIENDKRIFTLSYWNETFHLGLKHFIDTPRNAIRLINHVKLTYPTMSEFVNFTDFVTIQAIRLAEPEIYNLIMSRPDMFYGYASERTASQEKFHELWITAVPENRREFIQSFLGHVFPRLKAFWANTMSSYLQLYVWRKERRICSPDCFNSYFTLVISGTQVTEKEMKDLISVSNNQEVFAEQLLSLSDVNRGTGDGSTRLKTVLETLPDYIKDIPTENTESILKCFFNHGDEMLLPQDKENRLISWGNDMSILRFLQLLIERENDKKQRFETIKMALSDATAIFNICTLIRSYSYEDVKSDGKNEPPIEKNDSDELKKIAVRIFERNCNKVFNGQDYSSVYLIKCWGEWGNKEDIKRDLKNLVTKMDYDDFLRSMHNIVWYQKSSKYLNDEVIEMTPRLETPFLIDFFDLEIIFEKVKAIKKSYLKYLNMKEKIVIELFDIWIKITDKGGKLPEVLSKDSFVAIDINGATNE